MALSGGLDSTTLLHWLLEDGCEVVCVSFQYGSKHNRYELRSAKAIFNRYHNNWVELQVPEKRVIIDTFPIFQQFNSALLRDGEDIPEGHYTDESMSQTVVPARNMIFLSIMAGLARSEGADSIAIAAHKGDHAIYADCRTEFHKAMDTATYLATDNRVSIETPFTNMLKREIVGWGLSQGVPYALTRTCYKAQEFACGKCGACVERLEAFGSNGARDPIPYEQPLGLM